MYELSSGWRFADSYPLDEGLGAKLRASPAQPMCNLSGHAPLPLEPLNKGFWNRVVDP